MLQDEVSVTPLERMGHYARCSGEEEAGRIRKLLGMGLPTNYLLYSTILVTFRRSGGEHSHFRKHFASFGFLIFVNILRIGVDGR